MMSGVYRKFNVTRANGEPIEEFSFVLLVSDPHARTAMLAYAESVRAENPQLWSELQEIVFDYENPDHPERQQ